MNDNCRCSILLILITNELRFKRQKEKFAKCLHLSKCSYLTYLTFVCSIFGENAEICCDCRICFSLAKVRFICDNVANYFSKVVDSITSLGLVIKVGRQIKGRKRNVRSFLIPLT